MTTEEAAPVNPLRAVVETVVRAAREVAPSQGYVELQRKYRVVGTQNVRTQVLLLGYRRSQGGWTLVEFRAVG